MARDIEEFLRRAAERRKQQAGNAASGKQNTPAKPQPPQPSKVKRRPPPQRPHRGPGPRPVEEEPVIIAEVEVVEEQRIQPNLRSSIDTSDISKHADSLGKKIGKVHDRVEREVHENLDHNVGHIDDTPTVTDDPPPEIFGGRNNDAAKELRKLLSNPKSVGQAIIISEILKRPDFD